MGAADKHDHGLAQVNGINGDAAHTADLGQLAVANGKTTRQSLPRQVRDSIAAALLSDDVRAGDRLPGECALAERLEVSRSTVREAMRLLEQEGLVETRRGSGRFASAIAGIRPERPITELGSIAKMMKELGYEVTTTVADVKERPASPSEQLTFALKPGCDVVETRRTREHRGRPCVYCVNVLDPRTLDAPVGDIDWSGSILELLARMGHEIVASSAHITAVSAPSKEDELPGTVLPEGPWLLVTERCVTRTGRCVLLARDYHDARMFNFSFLRRGDRRHRLSNG